jgi:hypothetical protein
VSAPTLHGDTVTVEREWRDRAACRFADPAEFAPTISTPQSRHYERERAEREAAALRWCASCPVIASCSAMADVNGEEGVWGGSLRRKDHHLGRYVADPLIPEAPASRRTRNYGAVSA